MKQAYTAVILRDEGWWIGWIQEIPGVNCQERTKNELLVSLKSGLEDISVKAILAAYRAEGSEYYIARHDGYCYTE